MKGKLQIQAAEWAPKLAFFAVFGFTGLACLGAVKVYKTVKAIRDADLVITEEDWRRGQS